MKKMLRLLLTLVIIYFAIQYLFNIFSKEHDITYTINSNVGTVSVREVLTANNIENSYYFDVTYNDITIPFKIFNIYDKRKEIVKDVTIFEGNTYTCAYIKLDNDDNSTDIKCMLNNISYFYSSIKGKDDKLDTLVSSSDYNSSLFTSNDTVYGDKDTIKFYEKNYVDNQNVLLDGYKGVYLFGDKVTSQARLVSLYNDDVYDRDIETIVDKYYLVADYNSIHEFSNFIVVNIATGDSYTITSDYDISFDSFVEGKVDNIVYLIDSDNKKQYEIDVKGKSVKLVGNEERGAKIYANGVWSTKNINEIIDNKLPFATDTITMVNNTTYDRVDLIGNSSTGTYYAYTKNGKNYDVYAIYTQDKNMIKNYLFTTTDLNRVSYKNGYIYYLVDNQLKVFGVDHGNRLILVDNELKYNENLQFYVY